MADAFNELFINKIEKLRENVSGNPKIAPTERLREFINDREEEIPEFELKEINLETLTQIMTKKMKGKKGHGMDYIDSYSLKIAFPSIKNVILHLVNLSIRSGKFAKTWKSQLVLPLHKKGDKLLGSNYRPVSHISEMSKIVEYAVHSQFMTTSQVTTSFTTIIMAIWLIMEQQRHLSSSLTSG